MTVPLVVLAGVVVVFAYCASLLAILLKREAQLTWRRWQIRKLLDERRWSVVEPRRFRR